MAAIASRYARALADSLFERKQDASAAASDLRNILALLNESQPLREVWENPAVPAEQKRAVLDKIAQKSSMQPLVRNFLAVIIDHRRVHQLSEITSEFEQDVNRRMGLAEAEITSARELSPEERRSLEQKIAALTGKTIRANYRTDTSVLGGAVVRVGSTVFDGSVRGQLQKLKEQLIAAG